MLSVGLIRSKQLQEIREKLEVGLRSEAGTVEDARQQSVTEALHGSDPSKGTRSNDRTGKL